jgi:hypothetical protein
MKGRAPKSQVMSRSATESNSLNGNEPVNHRCHESRSTDHFHDSTNGQIPATHHLPVSSMCEDRRREQELFLPPYIVEDRLMLSRTAADRVHITHTIEPGNREQGCLTCCFSPDYCPYCVHFGCGGICTTNSGCGCDYPEYAVNQLNASLYVNVRENSVEWNEPSLRYKRCCSNRMEVMDGVSVVYFDDSQFGEIRTRARWCSLFPTFCCGGKGEQLLIEKTCCCGICLRGKRLCCVLVPSCLGDCCCIRDCVARRSIWVEDAEAAKRVISEARDKAKIRMKV